MSKIQKILVVQLFSLAIAFAPISHAQHNPSLFKQDASTKASDTQRSILAVDTMLEKLVCSDIEKKIWLEGLYSGSRQPIDPSKMREVFDNESFYYTLLPLQGKKINSKQIASTYKKVSQITDHVEDILLFFTGTLQRAYTSYTNQVKRDGKKPINIDEFIVLFAKGKLKLKHPKTGKDYKEFINERTQALAVLTKELDYGCNERNNFIYRKGSRMGSSIDLNAYVIPATHNTRTKVKEIAKAQKEDGPNMPAAVLSDHNDAETVAHDRYKVDSIASRVRANTLVGATFYFTPSESDPRYAGAKTKSVYDTNFKEIAKVTPAFYEAIKLQGAGILSNGKTINFVQKKLGVHRFKFTNQKYGVGKSDNALVPWRSIAIDFNYYRKKGIHLKLGQKVFIPSTYGLKIPGTDKYHNGVWELADVGGAIDGARIDMFIGTMHWKDALSYVKDSSNYNDGKRNKDSEKLGSKSRRVALQILR